MIPRAEADGRLVPGCTVGPTGTGVMLVADSGPKGLNTDVYRRE